MKYILASASPRRRELLKKTGIDFDVFPSSIEEKITKTVPAEVVMELAAQKACDVFHRLSSESNSSEPLTVIGADTVVVYQEEILGKPEDETEALDMLSMLADRTHQVYTGVSIITNENGRCKTNTFFEKTDVTFYPIFREDLLRYIASGDCLDKAGAYGIQGDFSIHIKEIQGDYNNVVGLPIGRVYRELKKEY